MRMVRKIIIHRCLIYYGGNCFIVWRGKKNQNGAESLDPRAAQRLAYCGVGRLEGWKGHEFEARGGCATLHRQQPTPALWCPATARITAAPLRPACAPSTHTHTKRPLVLIEPEMIYIHFKIKYTTYLNRHKIFIYIIFIYVYFFNPFLILIIDCGMELLYLIGISLRNYIIK